MSGPRNPSANRRRGAALIMVLVLMAALASLAMTNAMLLTRLGKFLRRIDQEQTMKFDHAPLGEPAKKVRR